ncbi:MAG: dockerin type I domain-containing protein [Ruminococcus sp.]|nr:dockerin type I domain-containing protein [Ruminococcus sp.]
MIQKIKRPLSILLSIMMVVSLFTIVPITASAAEQTITINSGTDKLSNHGIQNLHYGNHSDFNGNGLPWGTFVAPTGKVFTKIVTNGTDDAMNWTGSAERVDHDGMMGEWYIDCETDEDGFRPFTISFTLADAITTYTVTWKNGETTLKTDTVDKDAIPAYTGDAPTKAENEQYSYTFTGWTDSSNTFYSKDSNLPPVTKDETYTATFASEDKAVKNVIVLINALPAAADVTVADKAQIESARAAYDALTDDQKAKVSDETLEKLTAAETALAAAQKEEADTTAANTVATAINALPASNAVTTADKDAIEAARAAYDALTDAQKALVTADTLKVLTDAEDVIAAAEVTKQINDLPEEIKLSDKTDVEAARAAYDALTDAQKALVTADTLKVLTDAEDAITAAEVTKKINDLPEEIKLSDKTDVEAARAAYDALTDAQKALVDAATLKVLTDAEDAIAAAEVTKKIKDIPDNVTIEDKDDVHAARAAFNALSYAQKGLVDANDLVKLNKAERDITDLTTAKDVTDAIDALPSNVTAGDKENIEAARAAYNALTDKQKALVSADTLAKLTDAEGKLAIELADKEEADKVTAQINDLPLNVNLKQKDIVEAAREAYDALTDNQKSYVTKEAKNKLTAAEKRIADQKAASIVIFKINTLPSEITLDSKTQIEATRAAYNALTADQKKWVDAVYVKKLTDAEDALAKIVADQQAANDVTTLINALPETITLTDKTNVEAARAAYNALTDDQKAYVSADTLKKLTDAEAALAVVVADKQAADDVATLINALPAKANVTLDDQTNIEAARSAYSALSYNQKGYVDTTTYAKLTGAEAGLAAVKADKKAADDVAALINALPTEVTLNDQTDIEAARAAYGALTDNQKAFIDEPTLKKLTDAEAALSLLIDDKTAADNVINKINALPAKADVTLDDQTNIEATRAAFNALSVAQKGYVDAETQTKLTDAEAGLAAVKADKKAADDVAALIEALPAKADVTLNDKDNIEAARAAYDALTDKQKAFIDAETLTKLTDAEAGLAAVNADKKAADDVKALIDALPTNVVTTDKDNIEAARSAYNALTDSQKAFVDADTLTKLTDAEAALAQAFIDKGAADGVTDLINALPTENLSIDNRDQIKQAREAYDALTDAQKYYVTEETLKKLTDVEDAFAPIEKLYNDQKAALNVEYMIDDLPDTITPADKEDVEAARAAYNDLTDDQKKWVEKPFLDKLVAAEDAITAADVTAKINALPENITLDDKDDVEAARAAFNGLSFDQKGYITPATQTKLSSAEAVIAKLVADKNAADAVTKKITDLPETITLNDKNDVEAARSAYNALTDDQKALITGDTLTKLTDAEAALATVLADKEAADDVISKINALPAKDDVTLDDETDITAARSAFNGLSVAQKGYVDAATQTKLTDAEAGLAAVKADKKAADDVKAMIDALPETITLNDKTDVEAARKAYDDLTDKQKAFVDADTLKKLTDAEKDIEVEKVKEMINNLPAEVTLDNVNDVVATSEAYENLTDAQRAKIDANAVKKLVTAANAAVKLLADYKEAEKVANQINALPENISVVNKDAVVAAREAYNALTDDQKALIDEATYNKLTDAEAAMDDPYYLIGDVDGNGTVNINDATAIQKYLAGLLELDETQIKCADTNADGNVTIGDATMIQKYISGLVDHLG